MWKLKSDFISFYVRFLTKSSDLRICFCIRGRSKYLLIRCPELEVTESSVSIPIINVIFDSKGSAIFSSDAFRGCGFVLMFCPFGFVFFKSLRII